MRLTKQRVLISEGGFPQSDEFRAIQTEIANGLSQMVWPTGSEFFELNPTKQGNGVKPIKSGFMSFLGGQGWMLEHKMDLGSRLKPGPVDAVKMTPGGRFFAIEWETGNISSSHRAMNKMALGLIDGLLAGGILILPSRGMYRFLTDRIGNFAELEPYFPVWERLSVTDGYLAVIEIDPDGYSSSVPLFPKGTDGWNLYQNRSE